MLVIVRLLFVRRRTKSEIKTIIIQQYATLQSYNTTQTNLIHSFTPNRLHPRHPPHPDHPTDCHLTHYQGYPHPMDVANEDAAAVAVVGDVVVAAEPTGAAAVYCHPEY